MPDLGPIVVCLFVCLSVHHNGRISPKGGSDLNLRMGLGSAPLIWHPRCWHIFGTSSNERSLHGNYDMGSDAVYRLRTLRFRR